MKKDLQQSMTWLHTWAGLVVGWVLFFIFVTGTIGYFYMELDRWMRPEQPLRSKPVIAMDAVTMAEAHLKQRAAGADAWTISLPGTRQTPYLSVNWRMPPELGAEPQQGRGRFGGTTEILDTETAEVLPSNPRSTGGAFLLYRMHWALHYMPYQWATWIVGICTMFMFVAILTGVVIVYKKILKEFFTFRRGKGARSWMDMHTVISITSLPFFAMITFTGFVFYLYTYMPLAPKIIFGDEANDRGRRSFGEQAPRAGENAELFSLTGALSIGEQYFGVGEVRSLSVQYPGDATSSITITPRYDQNIDGVPQLKLNGVTGELISAPEIPRVHPVEKSYRVLLALHEGNFADIALRWLYFISGVLGCIMIASGLVLWTIKRRPKQIRDGGFSWGHLLVERLNIGTLAGLPVAIALFFIANRLLPFDLANRREWEVHVMFIAWALTFAYPVFRPIRKAWVEILGLAAALYMLIPVINALTTNRHLAVTIPYGDWVLAWIDIVFVITGLLFATVAYKVSRRKEAIEGNPAVSRAKTKTATAEPLAEAN